MDLMIGTNNNNDNYNTRNLSNLKSVENFQVNFLDKKSLFLYYILKNFKK